MTPDWWLTCNFHLVQSSGKSDAPFCFLSTDSEGLSDISAAKMISLCGLSWAVSKRSTGSACVHMAYNSRHTGVRCYCCMLLLLGNRTKNTKTSKKYEVPLNLLTTFFVRSLQNHWKALIVFHKNDWTQHPNVIEHNRNETFSNC